MTDRAMRDEGRGMRAKPADHGSPITDHASEVRLAKNAGANLLLAYVFWHWKRAGVTAKDYENRQRAFHGALAAAPSSGFLGSFSVRLSNASWAADGGLKSTEGSRHALSAGGMKHVPRGAVV